MLWAPAFSLLHDALTRSLKDLLLQNQSFWWYTGSLCRWEETACFAVGRWRCPSRCLLLRLDPSPMRTEENTRKSEPSCINNLTRRMMRFSKPVNWSSDSSNRLVSANRDQVWLLAKPVSYRSPKWTSRWWCWRQKRKSASRRTRAWSKRTSRRERRPRRFVNEFKQDFRAIWTRLISVAEKKPES